MSLEAIRLLVKYLPESRDASNLDARAACELAAWMSISGVGAAGMRLSHFRIAHAMDIDRAGRSDPDLADAAADRFEAMIRELNVREAIEASR